MKAPAVLILLIVLPVVLPAQAKDSDDLGSWSLEELCENKDKRKHAEAVFAEFERRGTFKPFEIELIRDTRTELVKLDEKAVQQANWRHIRRSHDAVDKKAGPPQPDKDGLYHGSANAALTMMLSTIQTDAPTDFDARLAMAESNLWLWGFPGTH